MQTIPSAKQRENAYCEGYSAAKTYLESNKTKKYPRCPYCPDGSLRDAWLEGCAAFEDWYYDA